MTSGVKSRLLNFIQPFTFVSSYDPSLYKQSTANINLLYSSAIVRELEFLERRRIAQ
jgi:hypothetical protein